MPNPDSIYLDTVRLQQLEREILVLNGPTKVAEIDRFPFTTHAEFVEAYRVSGIDGYMADSWSIVKRLVDPVSCAAFLIVDTAPFTLGIVVLIAAALLRDSAILWCLPSLFGLGLLARPRLGCIPLGLMLVLSAFSIWCGPQSSIAVTVTVGSILAFIPMCVRRSWPMELVGAATCRSEAVLVWLVSAGHLRVWPRIPSN